MMGVNKKTVSIVVPCFNEAESVDNFFSIIKPLLDADHRISWDIVFVDDGSSDNTLHHLVKLSTEHNNVTIIELSRNFGKEAALTAGIDTAKGQAVIPIDADLQDPPTLILNMVSEWLNGAEVVLARRKDRSSDGYMKRQTAAWFYFVHNRLSKTKIPDNVGDFRLMDRCVVEAIKQLPERQRFMKGLFAWVGFKTVTIEYVRASRIAGNTKFSAFALVNFAMEGVTSFSTAPLKVSTYFGGIGALFTFFYALFITGYTIIHGNAVPGYASLLVAVLFFGSVQLISIGLLGEYIGRIYLETKQRPTYLVRKTHGATRG
jgi:glycosyltransferase involved in cell wall biosynthesis